MKASVGATLREGSTMGIRTRPGNSYDGRTFIESFAHVEVLRDHQPALAINVDGSYRRYDIKT